MSQHNMKVNLILLALLAIFVVNAILLDFTQDDAFISFRYVRNFVNGEGLVFNPGERVEGYTNFFWILVLSIFVKLGFDIIVVSKVLGVICGVLIIILLYLFSCRYIKEKYWYLRLIAPAFLVSNSAFAYWSISGLETSFFALMVLLSFWVYLRKKRLAIVFLALSSLIRPEGILIFLIFLIYKLFVERDSLRECGVYLAGFFVLLLPHFVFRYFYYQDLLPNPFYAKVGLSGESLKNGLEYFWLFLRHYGFWGILYLIPVYLYKRSDNQLKLFALIIFVYTTYIIGVGGDVLKVHRFFIPILPFIYLFAGKMVFDFFTEFRNRIAPGVVVIVFTFIALGLTFYLPRNWVLEIRSLEQTLVDRMKFTAENLQAHFGSDLSLAVSTIGSVSYHSPDSRVIDMLGLTDKEISHNPDYIPGIPSSWKEKKYNAAYILSQDPDYIIFSTGYKPSAPAERALLLYSKFRQNYYVFYTRRETAHYAAFKKKGTYRDENQIFPDTRFVDLYNEALNLFVEKKWLMSVRKLKEVLETCPQDFVWVYEEMGKACYLSGNYPEAKKYLHRAIEMDPY
ncbi:MAG: tetratricopeptide repeat protein, partial [Candidatus Zixiibacteriota bacterium]